MCGHLVILVAVATVEVMVVREALVTPEKVAAAVDPTVPTVLATQVVVPPNRRHQLRQPLPRRRPHRRLRPRHLRQRHHRHRMHPRRQLLRHLQLLPRNQPHQRRPLLQPLQPLPRLRMSRNLRHLPATMVMEVEAAAAEASSRAVNSSVRLIQTLRPESE